MSASDPRPAATHHRSASDRGAVASVRLWGHEVGAVAEEPGSGRVVFEYAEEFRTSGLEISPMNLPLSRRGPQTFDELGRSASFMGLPGVLADSLPDAFGNAIISRYFEQQGRPQASLSPVQRLLYVGRRGMGALEFHPPTNIRVPELNAEALEVAELVDQARRVIDGDTTIAIPEIMQVGATAGGARAKGLILWDRERDRVRSGFAAPEPGEEAWLVKFDGVTPATGGHELGKDFRPGPYGRIEYAYSKLARRAQITMAETHLLRERDYAHFMTKRFDRIGEARLHMHSLGGLLHADFNLRQLVTYEQYFRTIQELELGFPAVLEAYRRMVFNLAARNQDDHVKNFAFLMDASGKWSLAPAFDLIHAVGGRWATTHQMRVNGKDDDFSREDLLALGAKFNLPVDGKEVLRDVEEALAYWPQEAADTGLGKAEIERIRASFRHFA
ncbi:MAG: type II toxin-antitoxin system HipA family toxin [Gemmatimonadota bacterium]